MGGFADNSLTHKTKLRFQIHVTQELILVAVSAGLSLGQRAQFSQVIENFAHVFSSTRGKNYLVQHLVHYHLEMTPVQQVWENTHPIMENVGYHPGRSIGNVKNGSN